VIFNNHFKCKFPESLPYILDWYNLILKESLIREKPRTVSQDSWISCCDLWYASA